MENLSLFDVEAEPPAAAQPDRALAPAAHRQPPPAPRRGPTLLAVDGNSLAHRAFHAYGAVADRGGLYGFLALLVAVTDIIGPDAVIVGFDCRGSSVRKQRWSGYKANRGDKDPALIALLERLPTALRELGVAVVVPEGWEADDVIGSAACGAEAAGWRCVVATSDRDAYALISERTTVLRLTSGMDRAVEVTAERLRAEIGVCAAQYVEFAALRGDTSDNLPGIRGIGPSRAAALLRAYATVAEAGADPIGCLSVLGRPLGQALLNDLADPASVFRRNVGLMTIRRDLPVDVAACRRSVPVEQIAAHLAGWGLPGLAARVAVALGAGPATGPALSDADAPAWVA
ncbi:MAG: flap endonuclease [Actinomycetota bacterium]|jgi:DNA polymerase-1|nr:flap endonuclease [Actinomycetota bacterium]